MADSMTFPETIEEFIDSFSFKDTEEVYTNGAQLIPVFRVQQALEHYYIHEAKQPEFLYNKNDCVSVWKCQCGNIFQTKHQVGVLDGTDVNFCCRCGVKYDWKGE